MKIDAGFEGPVDQIREWAKKVEASGHFQGAWVSDTNNDPFLLSSALVAQTDHMTIGTNIAVAFARSPFCMAQTAYNLRHLSGGRFTLGLGTQVRAHITRRFSMDWPEKPVAAMKEYVCLLRHLFQCFQTNERPSFHGDFFSCTLSSPVFTPTPHNFGPPPVGFAAVGPAATRAAGEVAEAVFLHPFTHLKFLREVTLPALAEGRASRDSSLRPLEVVGSAFCLSPDRADFESQKQKALGRLAFYASTPNYAPVVESLGYQDLHSRLHDLSRRGEWQKMAQTLPADFVEACVVIAPRSEMIKALRDRFQSIYDRVVVDAQALYE